MPFQSRKERNPFSCIYTRSLKKRLLCKMKRKQSLIFWSVLLILLILALLIVNILFYKHIHTGCRSWVCTYEKHKFQPIDDCTDYHIKADNYTVDCYACLKYIPINGSVCYDNALSKQHGGYCAAYQSCENESVYAKFLAIDLGGACFLLVMLAALGVLCATKPKEYEVLA